MPLDDHLLTWAPPPAFWSGEFLSATGDASKPALFKGVVPGPEDAVLAVEAAVRRARDARSRQQPSAARVRIYTAETRRDELIDDVLLGTWPDDEGVCQWMRQLTGHERFSLIVNNLETLSESLSTLLAEFTSASFAGWGVPVGGCEQVAFLGNYSGTAFGVHEGYEDAFLVHLGPGVKHFYCWSQDSYVELTGSNRPLFGDYQWLLEHGELFDLEPGDILFLPRRVFHVGRQDSYSISVALPFYTYPIARILGRSLLPHLFGEELRLDDSIPSPMYRLDDGWMTIAKQLVERARSALNSLEPRLDQDLGEQASYRWYAIMSNGGWEISEHDLSCADAKAAVDTVNWSHPVSLRLRPPYRVLWAGEQPHRVFLRGSSVDVTNWRLVAPMLRDLERGLSVTTDPSADTAFWADLARTGGLEVLDSAAEGGCP